MLAHSSHARAIEAFFRERYGQEALYVPSGRAALYLAFREWLRPGDRILMSPVTDDVVFFVVLAAGLVPVLGPVDPSTGNLDPAAIGEAAWATLRGVLTTNLYGIPDRMDTLSERCRRHHLVLLEDAAHALDSHCDGRRIGQFGVAAAYSLHKHLDVEGGVLTFAEAGRRAALEREAALAFRHRPLAAALAHEARSHLSRLAGRTRLGRWLRRWRARLVATRSERPGHRMAYDLATVRGAQQAGGGLDHFDRWVRTDNQGYRTWPSRSTQRLAIRRLHAFEAQRSQWLEGIEKLRASGLVPTWLPVPADTALFRVPLFVPDRESARARFAQRGLALDYIYHPLLDQYAPELTEGLPSSHRADRGADHWTRDVLPVDPRIAVRFLEESRQLPEVYHPPLQTVEQTA